MLNERYIYLKKQVGHHPSKLNRNDINYAWLKSLPHLRQTKKKT